MIAKLDIVIILRLFYLSLAGIYLVIFGYLALKSYQLGLRSEMLENFAYGALGGMFGLLMERLINSLRKRKRKR